MSTVKVFQNKTSFCHIGRPHDVPPSVLPLSFIDHAAPLGANLWIPPKAIHVDNRGQVGMVMNSAQTFWCVAIGPKDGIEADLAALGRKLDEEHGVEEYKGKTLPDGTIAVRFRLLTDMLLEVTREHKATLDIAGDTIQSTLKIGALQDELKKKHEEAEKAKKELAEIRAELLARGGSQSVTDVVEKRSTFPKGK